MCLAKAFVNNWSEHPVFQDIAHMRVNGDRVELETLFGEEKVIPGRVVEIDFSTSRILLDEYHEADKS
jgi:predicted RNA-binding protein